MSSVGNRVTLLAGGVGGAKMAVGLAAVCAPEELAVIGNVGDDQEFHGLWVSPDIDTLTYTLGGVIDSAKGWGLADESSRVLESLERFGCQTWMFLGDRDFATHIYRTQQRRAGVPPSDIADQIARAFGVRVKILLPTNDTLQTELRTQEGWLAFQEYFVREQCRPDVLEVRFRGSREARPTEAALEAIRNADLLVIAPSNPVLSIAPILSVPGVRRALAEARGYRLAVSPLLGGRTVKGPADRVLAAAGYSRDSAGIANYYAGLIDGLAIDVQDGAEADALRDAGLDVLVTETLMRSDNDKARLAAELMSFGLTPG